MKFLIFIILIINTLALHAQSQSHLYAYLRINLYQQDTSRFILKETYTRDHSKDAVYRKRFLSAREEFDEVGRTTLHLYYDHEGDMQSKIILFYPKRYTERAIFHQRGGGLDSVVYVYDDTGKRLAEYWVWGNDNSHDTVLYRYNNQEQLVSIWLRYLGNFKRDTLLYRDGLLEKALTYNLENQLQKEVEFVFLDSVLFKANWRNRQRLIVEEEFFFYDKNGNIAKTISKLYPEGEEEINPPRRVKLYKYWKNNRPKSTIITAFTRDNKKNSISKMRYNKAGNLLYQFDYSRQAGIHKKVWFDYTMRPN